LARFGCDHPIGVKRAWKPSVSFIASWCPAELDTITLIPSMQETYEATLVASIATNEALSKREIKKSVHKCEDHTRSLVYC
jgi:hypothetical protein